MEMQSLDVTQPATRAAFPQASSDRHYRLA